METRIIPFTGTYQKYYATDTGDILDEDMQIVHAKKSNKRDKKMGVMIHTKKGSIFFYRDKLVIWAFTGKRKNINYYVHHKDHDTLNDRPDNLEYREKKRRGSGESIFGKLTDKEFVKYNDALNKIPRCNYGKFNTDCTNIYYNKIEHIKCGEKREFKLNKIFNKLMKKYEREVI
jgi:hypothetical protein